MTRFVGQFEMLQAELVGLDAPGHRAFRAVLEDLTDAQVAGGDDHDWVIRTLAAARRARFEGSPIASPLAVLARGAVDDLVLAGYERELR